MLITRSHEYFQHQLTKQTDFKCTRHDYGDDDDDDDVESSAYQTIRLVIFFYLFIM